MNYSLNKAIHLCFYKLIETVQDKYFDFAIDDPLYEMNHINKKDYDDSKQLDWGYIAQQRFRTLKDNGNWGIWCGWGNVINILMDILWFNGGLSANRILDLMRCYTFQDIFDKYSTWKIRNWIIWDRQKGRGATYNVVSTREDFIWLAKKEKSTFNKFESNIKKVTGGYGNKNGRENRLVSNVWSDISPSHPKSKEYKITNGYKGQKPVALIDRCIKMLSNEGDIGHDGFCGSGTFAVSCIKNNRRFVVNDINKKAIQITNKRILEKI